MKIRLLLAGLFLICFFSAAANAQNRNLETSVFSDYLNNSVTDRFIHIPGLEFKSSMGVSFASNGNQSQSIGYYMGHFNYGLGQSWNLNLDVGVRSMVGQQMQGSSNLCSGYSFTSIILPLNTDTAAGDRCNICIYTLLDLPRIFAVFV